MAKMKTPTLEEVREYFKDAEKVESVFGNKFILGEIYMSDSFGILGRVKGKTNVSHTIWNPIHGYAKILSYKEPKEKTYKITREQILKYNMKDEFPGFIEEHKKELFSKPILSLDDLLSVWGDINDIELYKTAPLFKSFEDLAESKLKEIGVNCKIV